MLSALDYTLIVLFLLLTAVIGIATRGKQDKSSDFFLSTGTLPGFVGNGIVGLSIAATFFSGITFLAYPSVILNHGLVIFTASVTFILQYFVVVVFFVPRFRRKQWKSPYEILEERFGQSTRKVSSILYILMRLGWMSALIYAPTVAILGATGLDDNWFWPVVLLVGLSSTIYSAFGGLRGIMVTDAMQMLVIVMGCLVTIAFIAVSLPPSFNEVYDALKERGTLRTFDFSFDISITTTTWSVLIGSFFATAAMYVGDQMSLQRYMTSESIADVRRSFIVNVVGVIGILTILAGIGLSLSAWVAFHPEVELPENSDQIFPFFVASQLPSGLAGLILAALLAATMSSMTSGINALSSTVQLDLMPRQFSRVNDRQQLVLARTLSFGIGLTATLGAGLVAQLGQIFDITQKLLGLFLGPLGVCLIVAVLPVQVSGKRVITGMIAGFLTGAVAAFSPQLAQLSPVFPQIGSMWVAPIAILVTALTILVGTSWRRKVGIDKIPAESDY
tara:strand:- start:10405 stop:11916 length:1512 start_codon:yes stop_codon:yes gene_type:complete